MFITPYRDIMKDRLKIDIEFYHFAKQRLLKQWKSINDSKGKHTQVLKLNRK